MFLFSKRTRNVIKYLWGFFAIIIILSMVVTFSGFTYLARTEPASAPRELSEEELAALQSRPEFNATSSELELVRDEATSTATSSTPTPPVVPERRAPTQELEFSL